MTNLSKNLVSGKLLKTCNINKVPKYKLNLTQYNIIINGSSLCSFDLNCRIPLDVIVACTIQTMTS